MTAITAAPDPVTRPPTLLDERGLRRGPGLAKELTSATASSACGAENGVRSTDWRRS
jgi:hypothetical protein